MQISFASLARVAAVSAGLICLSHATARADLSACGAVDVRARAQCVIVPPSVDCKAMCTPVTVRAACSAKLAASCDAKCNELPSVDCAVDCEAGCKVDCMVDPGKFDCAIDCRASCEGECEASCSSNSDKTGCMASCSGACSVGCDKRCEIEPPSASCDARCKASCEGSCKVNTNLDCQIDCQADGYAKCEVDVTGGCKARCDAMEGALFCDGQFVDTGDKLKECAAALEMFLDARVDASASGSSDCDNGTCMAEGQARVSSDCNVLNAGVGGARGALLAVAGALGLGWIARRRRTR